MKRPSLILLGAIAFAILLPLIASAQVAILDLTNTAPGTYYAKVDVGQDGTVTITQIKQVVRLDGQPAPNPVPDDPTPAVLTARAKLIREAAEKATADPQRANTAVGLATAAKSVRILVADGTLTNYEQISKALAYLWDATTSNAAWSGTRSLAFQQLATLAQEGADVQSYGVCLADVEAGLRASVPTEMLQSGESDIGTVTINGQPMKADWSEIMKVLLEIFVKYILPLIVS